MTMTQAELLRKAAGPIGTGDIGSGTAGHGLRGAEQSTEFLRRVYDTTAFSGAQRNETRRSPTGTIQKMGIGGRILRKKTAGVDDATLIKPEFGEVEYVAKRYRADTEIEEEVFEDNIEGQGFEDHWINEITGQIGRDLEDLHFNGDETSADPFVNLNNGWLKLISAGGSGAHRVNGATIDVGAVTKNTFFGALDAMPAKFKTGGSLKFVGNPSIFSDYLEYLTNRASAAGDAALTAGDVTLPKGVGKIEVPSMPADRLLLVNPKNFIVVTRRTIRYRKTTEGRQAIRQDKRFYAWFLETDPIVEEMDAVVDVYGLV
jgi:hypothetical protein